MNHLANPDTEGREPSECTLRSYLVPAYNPAPNREVRDGWPVDTGTTETSDSTKNSARCSTDRWAIYTELRGSQKDLVGRQRGRRGSTRERGWDPLSRRQK